MYAGVIGKEFFPNEPPLEQENIEELLKDTTSIYQKQKDTMDELLIVYADWLKARKKFYGNLELEFRNMDIRHRFLKILDGLPKTTFTEKLTRFRLKIIDKIETMNSRNLYTYLTKTMTEMRYKARQGKDELAKFLGPSYMEVPHLFLNAHNLTFNLLKGDYKIYIGDQKGVSLPLFVDLFDGYYFLNMALDNYNNPPFDESDLEGGLTSMLNKAFSGTFILPGHVSAPIRGISFALTFFIFQDPSDNCSDHMRVLLEI